MRNAGKLVAQFPETMGRI